MRRIHFAFFALVSLLLGGNCGGGNPPPPLLPEGQLEHVLRPVRPDVTQQTSKQQPDDKLVDPGSPYRSCLYLKVTGQHQEIPTCQQPGASCGSQMPLGGSLTASERQQIHDWIYYLP